MEMYFFKLISMFAVWIWTTALAVHLIQSTVMKVQAGIDIILFEFNLPDPGNIWLISKDIFDFII